MILTELSLASLKLEQVENWWWVTVIIIGMAVLVWHLIGTRIRKDIIQAVEQIKLFNIQALELISGATYVRESLRVNFIQMARVSVETIKTFGWILYASPSHKAAKKELVHFIDNSKELVRDANDRFVRSELLKFSEFFNSIESNPLTDAQRRSCVVDEDNNLVLAGAGTGKTSTMIGRAGYLIASRRAQPDKILMLAFGRKAADEMQERQDKRLSTLLKNGAPKIKTFHALGLEIIGIVEGKRPGLSSMAEDKHRFIKFIDEQISKFCTDHNYQTNLIRYCGSEKYPYQNPFDFDSMTQYYDYVRANELRTLKGEVVKSFEECVIANFLSANSVTYEYEKPYKIDTSGPDYRQYKPDFFLPDYNIYIEHFALDEKFLPPVHFDQKKYLEGIQWKRDLHIKNGTNLIETYSYLKRAGQLESHLRKSLSSLGVKLIRRSNSDLLHDLRKSSEISEFAGLLSDFLLLFKESEHDWDSIKSFASNSVNSSRLNLLLDLFYPIYISYEAELSSKKQIDFTDMIRKATSYVESKAYQSTYDHILIDEFQDISSARARLILSLIKQKPDTVLFAVGDDWQSIYRFTGSDIAYIRDFRNHFGPTAVTPLDTTFRFNDQIGAVSSKFVLKNPEQIRKSIKSIITVNRPAISLIRTIRQEDGLKLALEAIFRANQKSSSKSSVLVLGRYNYTVDGWRTPIAKKEIKSLYPSLETTFMTIHAAKGKEADYVIILGLGRGKDGFPSEKPPESFLEFLLPVQEMFPLSEERRLFYVALTRARHRVYLIYNPMEASAFVIELLSKNEGYQICTDEFNPHVMCADVPYVPCPNCSSGSLIPKQGPYGKFIGCNNFPYCRHMEKPCPRCGSILARIKQFQICTNHSCNVSIPICSNCGAPMIERTGPFGPFWGCSNYRRKSEFFCGNTIKISLNEQTTGRKHSQRRKTQMS